MNEREVIETLYRHAMHGEMDQVESVYNEYHRQQRLSQYSYMLGFGDFSGVVKMLEDDPTLHVNVAPNSSKDTALMVAVYRGSHKFVKLFLEMGADPNIQNGVGRTAVMVLSEAQGVEASRAKILRLLLDSKPDLSITCMHGRTAHDYFISEGLSQLAAMCENSTISSVIKTAEPINSGVVF